jgi:CBS domain containing-hemolysin-like protein
MDLLNDFKTTASASLHDAINKANTWDNYFVNSISSPITSAMHDWLRQHPVLAWLFNHPFISLIVSLITVILIVRLILTIYRAIATTIDRMWLWILQSPFLLLKFLFGWEVKPKNKIAQTTITNYEVTNNSQQLEEIMTCLAKIQQQQEEILQDIALLKQLSPITKSKQIMLTPQQLNFRQKKSSENNSNDD